MKISQIIRYSLRSFRHSFKFILIKLNLINGYKPNINVNKINIGGGVWGREGWENLDIINNYKLEDELLSSFQSKSVNLIYTSHCIEHLKFDTTSLLLKDAYRVLKTDGVLRVVVPDTDKLYEIFRSNKDNKDYNFYNEGTRSNYTLKDTVLELYGFNLKTDKFLENSMHVSFYNTSSLKLLLLASGFNKFNLCSYGNSNISEFFTTLEDNKDGFDNPDTKTISLYLEATK